ncbi:hypothetical protein QBC41DRAFT_348706 [Cercophora samala]|uniref:Uncharacterized protein n=1 Tax=Cercophora samala TaxID=330535 RepID=A0AA40D995_9PEZI|nr:hypothetical protein QBC41DRAFT_348706 [Cercophora samala]
MTKEEWEKAWMNAYCIVCNPSPDGRTTTAHPMCLTTRTYVLDAEILRRVGLEAWVPREGDEPEGVAGREHPPPRGDNLASEPQESREEADELGKSSDEMSACSSQSEHEEKFEHEAQDSGSVSPASPGGSSNAGQSKPEPEIDEDSDDDDENEAPAERKKCRRCHTEYPVSLFKSGINSCNSCREKEKDARNNLKNAGRCTRCRQPLEPGFVGVRCLRCRERHNIWAKSHPKNKTNKGGHAADRTTPA